MRLNHVLSNRKGFALEATLFVLLLLAVLCAFAVTGVTTTTRTANYDYRNSRTAYAAEGAADDIMQQLSGMVDDGFISQTELDSLTRPVIPGFTIANMSVRAVGGATQETVNSGPLAGLYALVRNYDITARATDSSGNASQAVISVKSAAIPIFQFGVFYEKDLEVNNGARLDMQGWVHSNGNIYTGSTAGLYFHNVITTPNLYFHRRKDGSTSGFQVYIDNAAGTAQQVNQASPETMTDAAFRSWSESRFSGRLKDKAYGVDSLRLPLPDGVPPEELIRPKEGTDTPDEQDAKFAWKADFYIEVDYTRMGTTMCTTAGAITFTRYGRPVPNASWCALIFQSAKDAWWESREQTFVDYLDVDYQQLFNWMATLGTADQSKIMYITFTNVPDSSTANEHFNSTRGCPAAGCFFRPYPIVRIKNARRLGSPFTMATSAPFYVWGDYNAPTNPNDWRPSAIVGDAFTWLSSNWTDSPRQNRGSSTQTGGSRTRYYHSTAAAANDSIYAAILAGHSRTPFDYSVGGSLPSYCNSAAASQNYYYGGGLENFPRFLEGWGGITALYRGSLVSIAYSQTATNDCSWAGGYYGAPTRNWAFDTRFQDPANLPPGTPVVGSVIQTAFRPVYE